MEDPEAERAVTDERGRDKGRDRGSAKGNVERGRCSGRVFVIVERDDGALDRVSYNWKGSERGREVDIISAWSGGPDNKMNKARRKIKLIPMIRNKTQWDWKFESAEMGK